MSVSHASRKGAGFWVALVVGLVVAAIAVTLLAGGIYLIVLGGSWYYAIAGLGLAVVAVCLFLQKKAAVAAYAVVWLGTLAWTIWEVQFDWWAWTPRMVAPTVLFLVVLACWPTFRVSPRRAFANLV